MPESTARALGSLLRIDSGYGRATLRLAELDYQVNGLLHAMSDLDGGGAGGAGDAASLLRDALKLLGAKRA